MMLFLNSLTRVFILNNLFLSNNDFVDLGCTNALPILVPICLKEIQTTNTTKWDGVAFATKDKRITSVLVEFSRGVKYNTTDKKEQGDETKMVGIINILKFIEALQMVNYPVP
ncbi:hypothetical protein INT45_012169 [Circinella minor]|uniref:Uncharacterized protein n=1 Tax=Circinella minor TaxID=1195481 RepID=A0A8H7VNQ2_9FUNG|nr:hypothetical protein INT45_012169 [Circinella minor]